MINIRNKIKTGKYSHKVDPTGMIFMEDVIASQNLNPNARESTTIYHTAYMQCLNSSKMTLLEILECFEGMVDVAKTQNKRRYETDAIVYKGSLPFIS